jgi:hypothetical protein
MKNCLKPILGTLVSCSLVLSSVSMAGAGFAVRQPEPCPSLDLQLFSEQAVAPSLFNPVHPIYSRIKVNTVRFIFRTQVLSYKTALFWTPWVMAVLPLLPALLNDPTSISFLTAMAPPPPSRSNPPESPALLKMKRDILQMAHSRKLWTNSRAFMQRYITLSRNFPRNSPGWEKAVEAEMDNSRLFDWLRAHPDPDVQLVGALIDLHLAAMEYPGQIKGVDAALELI